jgi:hypothetical protein
MSPGLAVWTTFLNFEISDVLGKFYESLLDLAGENYCQYRALDNFSTRGVCHFQCATARCIWLPFIDFVFGDRRKKFVNKF